jgi:hypothetical protein
MAGKWTPARKLAHSRRIRQLRALGCKGPYALQAQRLADAHRAGRHPGFRARVAMSDADRRERAREATQRYRVRQRGIRPYFPSVREAGARLDVMLRRSVDVGHDQQRGFQGLANIEVPRDIHPLAHLWSIGTAADSVTDTDVNDALRMPAASYRPVRRGGVVAGWDDIWAQRHASELQRLVAEQRADAAA